MKKVRIEKLMEFMDNLEKVGYVTLFGGIRCERDANWIDDIQEFDELFLLTEYELAISTRNRGELRAFTTIKDKDILNIILEQHDIFGIWLDDNWLVIQTYVGEIKEYLYQTCEYTNVNKQTILSSLTGSLYHEPTGLSLEILKNNKTNDMPAEYIFLMYDKENMNIEYVTPINDMSDLLHMENMLQREFDIPSFIMGKCQNDKYPYEHYQNILHNIICKATREY